MKLVYRVGLWVTILATLACIALAFVPSLTGLEDIRESYIWAFLAMGLSFLIPLFAKLSK